MRLVLALPANTVDDKLSPGKTITALHHLLNIVFAPLKQE